MTDNQRTAFLTFIVLVLAAVAAVVLYATTAHASAAHCPDGGTIPPMPGSECTDSPEAPPEAPSKPMRDRVWLPIVWNGGA